MTQKTREWLRRATPKDIAAAQAAGELADVLEGLDDVEIQRRQHLADAAAAQAELDAIRAPAPTPGQGANADTANPDMNGQSWHEAQRARLRGMSPAEIVAAHNRGDLDELLNVKEQ